ncbi:MAG: hypothetical protein N2Z79_04320, partial [Candidatus Omnitrophica bacterium]|nr:hypothetical protein [Candidatus Omnitrophota bacterium]
FYTHPGRCYFLFVLYFFSYVLLCLRLLIKAYRKLEGLRKEQIKYIILSTIFGFSGGTFAFFPVFNLPISPHGIAFTVLYPFLTSYAIVKYRLMDIRIVITRAVIFLFVYFFILGIPFGLGFKLLGIGKWVIPTGIMCLLATLGPFLYNHLRKQLESLLKAEQIRAHRLLTEAAKGMLQIWQLNRLLKLMVYTVVSALRFKKVSCLSLLLIFNSLRL